IFFLYSVSVNRNNILIYKEVMKMQNMFDKNLIDLNASVFDEQELFDLVGMRVIEKGIANLGYISGLEKRELSYPTGLKFPDIPIALPHVDPRYIKKPFIYVVRNNRPIDVKQMGDSAKMQTSNFLFLGLKDGAKQPQLLAEIMAAFQSQEFVSAFSNTSNVEDMYSLLSKKFAE
ncbi:PTS sugar transporter subunit IIA, partial [Lactobacillus gasseri]